jgi:hypothetical protein
MDRPRAACVVLRARRSACDEPPAPGSRLRSARHPTCARMPRWPVRPRQHRTRRPGSVTGFEDLDLQPEDGAASCTSRNVEVSTAALRVQLRPRLQQLRPQLLWRAPRSCARARLRASSGLGPTWESPTQPLPTCDLRHRGFGRQPDTLSFLKTRSDAAFHEEGRNATALHGKIRLGRSVAITRSRSGRRSGFRGAGREQRRARLQLSSGQNRLVEGTSPGDRLARRLDCRKRRTDRPRRHGTLRSGRLCGSRRHRDARCIRPTGCERSSEETVISELIGNPGAQSRCGEGLKTST